MSRRLLDLRLEHAQDIVTARRRARQVASLIGLEPQEQTRLATAVSEVARNACQHAGGGEIAFGIEAERPRLLLVRIRDHGPGIADLASVLDGRGAGMGLTSSRRLVDRFEIRSAPGEGTEVTLGKIIPTAAPFLTAERIEAMSAELASSAAEEPLAELQQQNRELVRALDELRERHEAVSRLSRELEETNRGVVALYAELDERADQLKRADEIKTRFFSGMSHELRTPLNSIRALSRLLLDRVDGPLTDEQAKQVSFIRKGADDLMQIVDDLLDLAKIAAGKTEVRPSTFAMGELFGALRGMLRPLLADDRVALRFDDVSSLPALHTDEAKLSQIMRNLLSNALKFTERGEVRVAATACAGGQIRIRVSDTGIGIRPEDQERIFEEFTQVANPLQTRVKGTGLGLPLCRRLAALLGGELHVESEPGVGSCFTLTIPGRYVERAEAQRSRLLPTDGTDHSSDRSVRSHVLVIDDDRAARYAIRRLLELQSHEAIEAATGADGLRAAALRRPALIVLDLQLPDMSGQQVLQQLRAAEATRGVPVVIVTAMSLGAAERASLERLDANVYSKAMLEDARFGGTLRHILDRCLQAGA
jgi:signal transduction histidine kinase